MLLTASTIKDSPENVRFFVAANLASGVDHMFVFLDAPREADQREVAAELADHPHVTCVPTGLHDWWVGHRPASLNARQRINATWARSVLEPFAWADWLFHIDGDEVACLDAEALAEVPESTNIVWLQPLEAVSQWESSSRPTRFKRLLDDSDLNLLHVLGTIPEPSNQAYFHGHIMGKCGVRPRSGLALALHHAVAPDGRRQARHEDSRLRLLHYDAPSGEEFVRKWNALAHAGKARYRPSRAPGARALKTLITRDLSDETRAKYLRRIYESTTHDDIQTLHDLGLLLSVDPMAAGGTPQALTPVAARGLAARVEELRTVSKAPYSVDEGKGSPDGGVAAGAERLRRMVRKG